MTDNLATILDTEIDRAIGSWSNMTVVDSALKHTFGIA
jgi:mRNA interferase MazF